MSSRKYRCLQAIARIHQFYRKNGGYVTALFLTNYLTMAWHMILTDRIDIMLAYGCTLFLAASLITAGLNRLTAFRLGHWLKIFLLVLSVPVFILEAFVVYNYHALVGIGVISSILESNPQEAVEFFRMYVGVPQIVTVAVLAFTLYYIVKKRLWRKIPLSFHQAGRLIAAGVTVAIGFTVYMIAAYSDFFTSDFLGIQRFSYALMVARENMIAYRELREKINPDIRIVKNNSTIKNIVFILGESANRNHMNLYGYYLPNTPYLNDLSAKGEIAVFNDVVSPHSTTIAVLCKLFTFCHNESPEPWYKYNMLVDVMKVAGYKTWWLSNQESSGLWGNVAQLYAERSDQRRFTVIRDSKEDSGILDEELLPLLDAAIKNNRAAKNFYVLHLMGGHGLYYNRYPYIFHKFTEKDIRLDVDERSKLLVAEYDNALYYNDYIVSRIIDRFRDSESVVIYLPDHGEAVYDEGASFAGHIEENPSRHMIEIPFIVWGSPKFKDRYPDKWEEICNAVDRPYMTDDMIHTIMDIAAIYPEEFDPARSIINDDFDRERPRIFGDLDYDRDIRDKNDAREE